MNRIYTIGHSTRSIEEFVGLLMSHGITDVIDVRSFPGSRRYPHFNSESLSVSLKQIEIVYHHLKALGGRRPAKAGSKNVSWRNPSFRGYADYMETEPFKKGVEQLLRLCEGRRCVMMCSEALWWRCHRSMVSDYLQVKGIEVMHIMERGRLEPHRMTGPARVERDVLSYRSP